MVPLKITHGRIQFEVRFSVSFQRTLRVPDDGRTYPLPPGLGLLPIHAANEFGSRVPKRWRTDRVFVPLYQREALWLGFDGAEWKPNVVKIGIGGINAVSGERWRDGLHDDPQDYLVCPPQLWLDGINAGAGHIRQFVAIPLGSGATIEEQLSGSGLIGGLQIEVFEPKAGRFPDEPVDESRREPMVVSSALEMGMAAGGRITQKIYRDPYGMDTWDMDNRRFVFVHLLNAEQYHAMTGIAPPPTPISALTYTEHGFPWFDLYDEGRPGLAPAKSLTDIESLGEIGRRTGTPQDAPVDIPPDQVTTLGRRVRTHDQRDGHD